MKFAIFAAVLLVAVSARTHRHRRHSQPTCKTNEVYRECGTACEPSCKIPAPQACVMMCKQGCQCKPDFYRDDENKCVTASQCEAETECLKKYFKSNTGMMGAHRPTCDSEGNFERMQCHGSTGYCWCAKPATGEEIEGTKTAPSAQRHNCYENVV